MPGRPSGGGDRVIAVRAVVKCPITPRSTPALTPFTGDVDGKRQRRGMSAGPLERAPPNRVHIAQAPTRIQNFLPPSYSFGTFSRTREKGSVWDAGAVGPLAG